MTNILKLTDFFIFFVIWVVNFRMDPFTFICRVVYLLWFPFTLLRKQTNKMKLINSMIDTIAIFLYLNPSVTCFFQEYLNLSVLYFIAITGFSILLYLIFVISSCWFLRKLLILPLSHGEKSVRLVTFYLSYDQMLCDFFSISPCIHQDP